MRSKLLVVFKLNIEYSYILVSLTLVSLVLVSLILMLDANYHYTSHSSIIDLR
jgi:hypothetical protein